MIRRVANFMLAGLAVTVLSGCMGAKSTWMYPHAHSETLGETADEHHNRVVEVLEKDRRTLNEDLDLLFMTDRPTRLTRWHSR